MARTRADRLRAWRRVASFGLAGLVLATGGCTSSRPHAQGDATEVDVMLRDFKISMSRAQVSPGHVHFSIANLGPINHEFILLRTDSGSLPLRSDDTTVDEEALADSTVAALEPGASGKTRTLDVDLKPGRYEAICNMAGHYLGGMRAEIVVS